MPELIVAIQLSRTIMRKNARNLITTWGGTLNDYASRTWSGLVAGYYAVRWDMYIDAVLQAVENNQEFNQKELDNRLKKF